MASDWKGGLAFLLIVSTVFGLLALRMFTTGAP